MKPDTRSRPRMARTLVVAVAAAGFTLACTATAAHASSDVAVDAGAVVIVDPERLVDPLEQLTSDTPFVLRLPDGAACPGDSYNDNWRVQSFLLPIADDPGAMLFSGVGPEGTDGDARWPLRKMSTFNFVDEFTAQNDGPGREGLILPIPTMVMTSFAPDEVPPGTYRLGIACTYDRAVARYWDTTIEVSGGEGDGELAWIPDDVAFDPTDPGDTQSAVVPIVAGLMVVVGVLLLIRRRRRTSTTKKEEQWV